MPRSSPDTGKVDRFPPTVAAAWTAALLIQQLINVAIAPRLPERVFFYVPQRYTSSNNFHLSATPDLILAIGWWVIVATVALTATGAALAIAQNRGGRYISLVVASIGVFFYPAVAPSVLAAALFPEATMTWGGQRTIIAVSFVLLIALCLTFASKRWWFHRSEGGVLRRFRSRGPARQRKSRPVRRGSRR